MDNYLEKEVAIHSSILKNPMDRRAWQATVHEVARVGHDLLNQTKPNHSRVTSECRPGAQKKAAE